MNTSSTFDSFSCNVITAPEGILIQAAKETSRDVVVKFADGTQRMATKDVVKFGKDGKVASIKYTWLQTN